MPKVTVTVPHNRDPKKVIAKAKPAMEKMVHEMNGSNLVISSTETTLDFSFKTFGFSIKGEAEARPTEIEINVDLPLAAIMFKDMAASTIKSSVMQALANPDNEET